MGVLKLLGAARDPEVQEGGSAASVSPPPTFTPLLWWLTFTLWVHSLIEDFFEQVGRFAARRPYTLMGGTIFLGAVFTSGTITSWKERADFELWVPKGSEALKTRNRYDNLYQYTKGVDTGRFTILVRKEGGGSLLEDPGTLKEAMAMYAAVNTFTMERNNGDRVGLVDMCYRPWKVYPDLCMINTGLMAWKDESLALNCINLDTAADCTYGLDAKLVDADFSRGGSAALLARVNNVDKGYSDFFGGAMGPLDLTSNWGSITWETEGDRSLATDVDGLVMNWVVDRSRFENEDELVEFAQAFEAMMAKGSVKTTAADGTATVTSFGAGFDYTYMAPDSIDREFFAASLDSGDELGIGTVLMVLFATLTLGRYHLIEGRKAVAVCGIIDTWIATGSAFGVCMWMNYPYTPFSQIVPFLALGLGVDDAFIIVAALERTDKSLPLEDRFGEALRKAGASITLTSITDFIAFSVGSVNPISAMQFFCFHMAWAIFFDLFFQCTFFVAALVIDERRILARRVDCCCCFPPRVENSRAAAAAPSDDVEMPTPAEATPPPLLLPSSPDRAAQLNQTQQPYVLTTKAKTATATATEAGEASGDSAAGSFDPGNDRDCPTYYSPVTWFVEGVVVPLLGKTWFAIAAVALGVVFFGFGVNGMVSIKVDFTFKDVLLPDSFALNFLNNYFANFATDNLRFTVVVDTSEDGLLPPSQGFDYQRYHASTMDGLFTSLATLKFVEDSLSTSNSPSDWLSMYEDWLSCTPCCTRQCSVCTAATAAAGQLSSSCSSCNASACSPSIGYTAGASFSVEAFHTYLPEALTDVAYGGSLRNHLAYDESCSAQLDLLIADSDRTAAGVSAFAAACRPIAANWEVAYATSSSTNGWQHVSQERKAEELVKIRDKVGRRNEENWEDDRVDSRSVEIFANDGEWLQLDLYILLRELVIRSVFLVALCVMIVGGVMLIHPTLAGFMFVALTLICVDTMGGMYYWDVPLNPPSYMCIVISVGLSVDYCSHITYTFLLQPDGPRSIRAAESLREIGPSVIKGGFTTWLGLCMAFTVKLRMFHYFIKPLTLGVFFGLYHGIVLIPLACYYFGPTSVANMTKKTQGGAEDVVVADALAAEVEPEKELNEEGEGNENNEDPNLSCFSARVSPDTLSPDEGAKSDCTIQ